MSSAAVYKALTSDFDLSTMGIDGDSVFSDYSSRAVPREGKFVILRWGDQQYVSEVKTGATFLTVWVHQPESMGSDLTEVNKIHARICQVLTNMEHVAGEDGISVTSVNFDGLSSSIRDPGFHTIARNAGYRVLLRMVG